MSVYATFDESAGEQLASNRGWSDFVRWTDELIDDFPALAHLAEHGWADVKPLADELERAVKDSKPEADGLDKTIEALADLLADNLHKEAIFITDGMQRGDEGEPDA